MYSMNIQFKGVDSLIQKFGKSAPIVDEACKRIMDTGCLMLEANVKENTPVDKGLLRKSITHKVFKQADTWNGIVGTNLNYAPFQELGTGIYGPMKRAIRPVRAKMLAWKKGGQWYFARSVKGTPPKKMFEKGYNYINTRVDYISSIGMRFIKSKLG